MADTCFPDLYCDLHSLTRSLRRVATSLLERLNSAWELNNSIVPMDPDLQHLQESLGRLDDVLEPLSENATTNGLFDPNRPQSLEEPSQSAIHSMNASIESLRGKQHIVDELGPCLPSAELVANVASELQEWLAAKRFDHRSLDDTAQDHSFIMPLLQGSISKASPYGTESSCGPFSMVLRTPATQLQSSDDTDSHPEESDCNCLNEDQLQYSEDHHSLSRPQQNVRSKICWEGPAKVLRKWDDTVLTATSCSAKALDEICQLSRGLRFGERLDVCMPQDLFVACQDLADCAGWLLLQPLSGARLLNEPPAYTVPLTLDCSKCEHRCLGFHKTIANKEDTFMDMLPQEARYRHFAKRGALCFFSSLRLLTATELFEAAITKVLDSDIDWPFPEDDFSCNVQRFMDLCENFLGVDSVGRVRLRTHCLVDFFEEYRPISAKDGHFLMALLCLIQFKRHPRLILKPWLDFHAFRERSNEFHLHSYIVTYWYIHFREAEDTSTYLSDRLHVGIQAAWGAERSALLSLDPEYYSNNVEMGFHVEAMAVGLGICQAYGIRDLEDTYRRMDASNIEKYNCPYSRLSVTLDEGKDTPAVSLQRPKSNHSWSDALPHRTRRTGKDRKESRSVFRSQVGSVENMSSGWLTSSSVSDSDDYGSGSEASWGLIDTAYAEKKSDRTQ